MQQGRVLSWLSQHNFPHGLVSFADGLSPGFLGHKASYLKSLIQVRSFSCPVLKVLFLKANAFAETIFTFYYLLYQPQ
ncbi:hypothetical protein WDU94_006091 [Cyamophila willieti]